MLPVVTENVLKPHYQDESGCVKSRIDLFQKEGRLFDLEKARAFLDRKTKSDSTCFRGITRALPPVFDAQDSLEYAVSQYEDAVVALSGGLDSFYITSLIHQVTGRWPVVATLASHIKGYCELENTRKIVKKLGIKELMVIETDQEEFIQSLPAVIQSVEVPLYNLHPVSKWIFAKGVKELGYERCVTGDGVDQLFVHEDGHEYLPLVGAIFSDLGVQLECPLYRLDLRPVVPDSHKVALRKMAEKVLPYSFAHGSKRRGFTPPMDLSRYGATSSQLSDQEKTLQLTLNLLLESHG